MAQDIQKLVSIMEVKQTVTASGVGVGRSNQRSPSPDLPFWDAFETVSSSSSSSGYTQSSLTSGYSHSSDFFGRTYDKSLLIKDGICLAYQHGNCSFGQTVKHKNKFGKSVLHVCGLCWTDSPFNQCHSPAVQCPGPEHNLWRSLQFFGRNLYAVLQHMLSTKFLFFWGKAILFFLWRFLSSFSEYSSFLFIVVIVLLYSYIICETFVLNTEWWIK